MLLDDADPSGPATVAPSEVVSISPERSCDFEWVCQPNPTVKNPTETNIGLLLILLLNKADMVAIITRGAQPVRKNIASEGKKVQPLLWDEPTTAAVDRTRGEICLP